MKLKRFHLPLQFCLNKWLHQNGVQKLTITFDITTKQTTTSLCYPAKFFPATVLASPFTTLILPTSLPPVSCHATLLLVSSTTSTHLLHWPASRSSCFSSNTISSSSSLLTIPPFVSKMDSYGSWKNYSLPFCPILCFPVGFDCMHPGPLLHVIQPCSPLPQYCAIGTMPMISKFCRIMLQHMAKILHLAT